MFVFCVPRMIVLWMNICVNLCVCMISPKFTLLSKILSWSTPAPQHGNAPVHESIAPSPLGCSSPWSPEPACRRRFKSSVRLSMPRSAGGTALDTIYDHRAACPDGLSSAWPVPSSPWHRSQKQSV